ncbi:MAG TPA: hypothetical protein DCZ10_14100 [Pelotomaculum sp.]|nr:hypothetical protein [Pelotomaculum sp.]
MGTLKRGVFLFCLIGVICFLGEEGTVVSAIIVLVDRTGFAAFSAGVFVRTRSHLRGDAL